MAKRTTSGVGPVKTSEATRDELEREITRLKQRTRELEDQLRARDEFIGTLGHELRNPLSPLLLQAGFLSEQVRTAEGGVVSADWLVPKLTGFSSRLCRLLDVLNRLMDVSRIGAGQLPLSFEKVDLAETVRDVCASYERELAAAGRKLELHAREAVVGTWDRTRLEQIVGNLVSNAVRYGAAGPIVVTVDASPASAVVRVRDQGPGIAPEDRARIFERFERGAGRQQATGGFGLGLWITRNICEAMGGSIEVKSELGRGATFIVSLPRQRGRAP